MRTVAWILAAAVIVGCGDGATNMGTTDAEVLSDAPSDGAGDMGADADAATDADADAATDAATDADAVTDTDADTDAVADTDTDTDSATDTDTDTDTATDTDTDTDAATDTDAVTDTLTDTVSDADAAPDTDAVTDTVSDADAVTDEGADVLDCEIVVVCEPGFDPVDLDADGCPDECEFVGCASNLECGFPGSLLFCELPTCDATSGACAPAPQGCDDEWDPVCGCDGQTYGNPCSAASAGVSVDFAGVCDPQGCGTGGAPCDAGSFCEYADGICGDGDGTGTCVAQPPSCGVVSEPVCGCDGETYANDCLRQQVGVSKLADGACPCEPLLCLPGLMPVDTDDDGCEDTCEPQTCAVDTDCDDGFFCDDSACGAGDGLCAAIADLCVGDPDPVCGCDGVTYDTPCEAAKAAMSVAYPGPCQACGGTAGDTCGVDELCDPDAGQCGATDPDGVCFDVPVTCGNIAEPVCGCDGQTYANDCERQVAGVAKDADGACPCVPPTCDGTDYPFDTDGDGCEDTCVQATGCSTSAMCGLGFYCDKGGNGCVDGDGYCQPKPADCDGEPAGPVCGCDVQTYANACEAALAGTSVAFDGPCP